MGKIDHNIVAEVKEYVKHILERKLSEVYVFHSLHHTLDVLKSVQIIGEKCSLSEDELNILKVGALFHDIGYIRKSVGHEEESALIASDFLSSKNIDPEIIELVKRTILSTKVPQKPKSKLEKILCDADLMHLTYPDYFERIELMRNEWALTGIATLTENEFHQNSLEFFKSHNYHTDYGKKILTPLKHNTAFHINKKLGK